MTGEHWRTRLWWSTRRTVKWANTVVEMLGAIVMLHSALRYKEKLISSQAWWGSRQWKEILLQDRQYVEQQRDRGTRHGTGRINVLDWRGQEQHYWWLVVVWPTLLILTRGWWPVVLCGVTRVVSTTVSGGQWPTGYQSQSLKYVIVLLPCPAESVYWHHGIFSQQSRRGTPRFVMVSMCGHFWHSDIVNLRVH